MSGWHTRPFAAWDLETTAADPEQARIVTSTLVVIDGGQVDPQEWLVDPGVPIPKQAAAIHGVTTERAQAEGMDAVGAVLDIATAIAKVWSDGMPLVIYNANYDCTVLDRELHRHHGHGFDVSGPVIDPYVIDKALDRYRRGSRTLSAAVAHYGVTLTDAHSSLGDCLGAARVAWRLAQRYPQQMSDLVELHNQQVKWKADQAASFADYLRRQGKPADDVRGDWPLVPFVASPACVGAES
ncbi:3'-5' exonuclease [uncultured Jatrophihabitans sp.]|uniref:3'-5' exonuclease n=1 Tax=uncultured Jatrophihabitans sp. TaxID=1610747 RepID=UPI0035C952F5